MDLHRVVAALEEIAPLGLAEPWDKVGLQVATNPRPIRRALVCIDLTEPVMAEAVAWRAELLVAYHPPLFQALDRITDEHWKQRLIAEAVRRRIAIFSPHTALDAAPGGLTEWLCAGLGPGKTVCMDPDPATPGAGRIHHLRRPVRPASLARRIQAHLGFERIQLGLPGPTADSGLAIGTIAVCPGAGGSVFSGCVARADAFLTGEMQHHQVLDLVSQGKVVLLAGHANSERPYLTTYRKRLAAAMPQVEWRLSATDRSPLRIR